MHNGTLTPGGFYAASPNGASVLSIVRGMKAEPVTMLSGSLARPDLVEAALKGDPDKAYSTAASTLSLKKLLP
jgi:hypothetical protein